MKGFHFSRARSSLNCSGRGLHEVAGGGEQRAADAAVQPDLGGQLSRHRLDN